MARRLAAVGYFVVLPNLYYRLTRDFWLTERTEQMMAHMFSLMATLDAATTLCDTDAMLRFVDASPEADGGRIGAVGYCMSGPFVMWAAAARPERLSCIASIHGANMVTDKPDSPHRMPPKIRCESYFACAEIDKWAPPADVEKLQAALQAKRARRTAWSGIPASSTASSFRCVPMPTTGPRRSATGSACSACSSARCARRPDGPSLERLGQRRRRRPAVGARPALPRRTHRRRRAGDQRLARGGVAGGGGQPAAGRDRVPDRPGDPPRPCVRPEHARLDRAAQRPHRPGRRRRRPAGVARRGRRRARRGEAARRARHSLRRRHQRRRPPARARGRPAGGQHLARAAGGAAGDRCPGPDRALRRRRARPGDRGGAGGARHDARPLPAVVRALDRGRLGRDPIVRPAVAALRPDRAALPRGPAGDAARRARGRRPAGVERRARPARGGARQRRPARPPDRGDAAHPAARRARALPRDLLSRTGTPASPRCAPWRRPAWRCRCCAMPTRSRPRPSSPWSRATTARSPG